MKGAPNLPPLVERAAPGLSDTLAGPKHPGRCQSCGARHSTTQPLTRWLEHDAWDRVPKRPDTPRVVVLCAVCARALIERHARLYRELQHGEAFPGCMGVCLSCAHRSGVACDHERAQINGGDGLTYEWEKAPLYMHLCGGRHGGAHWIYHGPVKRCSGYERHQRAPERVEADHEDSQT